MPTLQQVQEVLYRARFDDQATAAARAATAAIDAYNESTDKSTESTSRATKTVNQLNAQNDVATRTARQLISATTDLNTAQAALAREQASGGDGAEQLGRTVIALIDKVTTLQAKTAAIVQAQDAMGSAAQAASVKLNALAEGVAAASAGYDSLRAQYDPLYAASMKYAQGLDDINTLQEKGSFNAAQVRVATENLTASFAKANSVTAELTAGFDAVAEAAKRATDAINAAKAASDYQIQLNLKLGSGSEAGSMSDEDYAARETDLNAYFSAMDAGRAKYDDLFRVSKQYSDQLAEIQFLQRAGALTEDQATVAIQNKTDAYAKANSVLGDVASAFDAVAAAAERATAQEQAAKEASQFQQVVNYQTGVNNASGSMSDADYAARQADLDAYGKTLDNTRAKYDTFFRYSKEYEAEWDNIIAAEKAGAIQGPVVAAAQERLNQAFAQGKDLTAAAQGRLHEYADETSKAGYIAHTVGIQFVQMFSGFSTGQPIFTTLIQQGHQVVDIFLSSQMTLKSFTSSLLGVFDAIGGVTTIIGVGLAGALFAFEAVANSQVTKLAEIRSALRGTQENYVAMAQTVEDVGKRVAASSTESTTAATKAAQTIAATNYFSGTATDLERLTRDAADLGKVLGGDAELGATKLSAGLNDTLKTAEALAPSIRTLDANTLQLIGRYQEAGDRSKAFSVLLQAIEADVKGQADDVSPLAKAWNELGEQFVTSGNKGKTFSAWLANDLANAIKGITEGIQLLKSAMSGLDTLQDTILRGGRQLIVGDQTPNNSSSGYAGKSTPTSSATQQAFVADWTNAANLAGQQLGVSPQVLLGHWGNETNFGKNLYDYNAGNIQAGAGYTGNTVVRGDTHADGSAYQTQFRAYSSPEDFAADFVKLLQNPRYASALNTNTDAAAYAGGLRRGGYFEDPNGVNAIVGATNRVEGMGGGSVNSGGMVNDQKALNDEMNKYLEQTRAIKAEKLDDQLDKIHLAMNLEANSAGTDTDKYKGLVQQEQTLTAEQHNNVDAQVAAARARQAALQATEGLTAGEQGLNAALAAGREIARTSGTPFGPEEQMQATIDYLAKQSQEYDRLSYSMATAQHNSAQMAAAYDQGDQAALTAAASQKAFTDAVKLFPNSAAEQGAAVVSLTKQYLDMERSANEASVAQQNMGSRDNLALINAETASIGMNSDARDVMIAKMKAEEEMHRKFGDILPAEAQRYIDLAGATVTAQNSLTQMQNSFNDLQNIGVTAFDDVGKAITDALVNGNKQALNFKNVFSGVMSEIIQQVLKLAVINPILNSIFGGTRSTLDSALSAVENMGAGGATAAAGLSTLNYVNHGDYSGDNGEYSGAGALLNSPAINGTSGGSVGEGLQMGDNASTGSFGSATLGLGSLAMNSSGLSAESAVTNVTNYFGNAAEATDLALNSAGDGVYGVATAGQEGLASAASAIGVGSDTLSVVSSGLSVIGEALPFIGTAVGAITDFTKGNIGGGVGTIVGAAIGTAILPGLGTALGGVLGNTIGGMFGNKHPENPFETVGVDVQDGQLAVGTVASQKEDVSGALQNVKDFTKGVNDYLSSVHLQISNPNSTIGGVGNNVTGWQQVQSASDLFQLLSFKPDSTVDTNSNFGKAETGALAGTKFMTPQELQDQLVKVAQFSQGLDTFGIHLASVGQRLLDIKIDSVDKLAAGISAVNSDGTPSNAANFRTALATDLPSQTFHTTDDFWAEVNKINQFVNGTLPSLLHPVLETTSQLQQQIQAMDKTYADAIAQAQSYGLATDALTKAQGEAVAQLQAADLKNLDISNVAIAKRGATARGEDTSQYDLQTFDLQADQQREALKQQYINIYGSLIPDAQEYGAAAKTLDQTLASERLAVIAKMNGSIVAGAQSTAQTVEQIIAQQRKDWDTNFSVLDKFNSIRARESAVQGDQKDSDLITFDDAAQKEQMDYARQLVDTYGNAFYQSADYTSRMSELTTVQEQERLAIIKKYGDAINTEQAQQLQTAQQSVGTLLDNLKQYAQSIRVGGDSPLSATQQYTSAKQAFYDDQQKANMGDYTAASQLQTLAQQFLSTSRAVNGSGTGYAADYSQVLDALTAVANVPQDVLTNSAIQASLQTQTVALSTKFDELKAELVAMRRELQQQQKALAA